jgi:hypothetical protein
MRVHQATLSPLTAIEHSRCGSAWPAKMAPSPAATNKSTTLLSKTDRNLATHVGGVRSCQVSRFTTEILRIS